MTENGKEKLETSAGKSSVIKEVTKELFDQSTIHGVKYIANRPLHEKIWWLMVCLVSIFICIFQIQTIYTKWKETPVVITIDEKFTSIGEIPFPAITICGRFAIGNETQFEYNMFTEQWFKKPIDAINPHYLDIFELASGQCFDTLKNYERKNMSSFFKERNSSFHETVKMMFEANIGEYLQKCRGIESLTNWPCNRGFVKVLTRNGVCLTFNMVRKEELVRENVTLYLEDSFNDTFGWSPENGYASKIPVLKKDEKYAFPHRIFTVGKKLQVSFKNYINYASRCLASVRVYIHHPHDFPWDMENSLLYSNADDSESIVVTPEIIKTSLHLRKSIPADRRSCLFDNERELMFFKIYSKSNCEIECLTNITLGECNCVMFWMPHFNGTPICGFNQHKCYSLLAYRYLNVNIASTSADIINQYDIPYKCNCVQRCNSVTYAAEKKSEESQKNMINEDEEEDDEDRKYSMPISLGRNSVAHATIMPPTAPPFTTCPPCRPCISCIPLRPFNTSEDEYTTLATLADYVSSMDLNVSKDGYTTPTTPADLTSLMNSNEAESEYSDADDDDEYKDDNDEFQDEYRDSYILDEDEKGFPDDPMPVFKPFTDKENFYYPAFRIEFQKAQILAYKRVAPYEISDFIANCGGLLGLFMGISVLSLVEILYFYTFRFVDAVRNVRKQRVPNELEEK